MATGPNKLFDDFAKLMTDATSAAQGVRREVESAVRAQGERIVNTMDLVQREEFEAVKEMAIKARTENRKLLERIAALEAKLGIVEGSEEATKPAKASSTRAAKK